jgi:hypothetical protein
MTKKVTIAGVDFELEARPTKGGYSASWRCLACGFEGGTDRAEKSEASAFAALTVGASFHASSHGRKKA